MATLPLSPALLLVLRDLRRTRARVLLRTVVAELVDAGHLQLVRAGDPPRRGRPPLLLRAGTAPVPDGVLDGRVAAVVAGAPGEVVDGAVVRDLTVVARHLAREPGLSREAVALVLGELEAAGLVTTGERRVLGVLGRTTHVRTAAGEEVLAADRPPGRRSDDAGGAAGAAGVTGGDDGDFDSTFDAGFSGGSGGDGGADGGGGGDGGGS